MNLIDGKALATKIRAEVKTEVTHLGRSPRLEVMLVGNDPASHLYVDLKRRAGEEAGIQVNVHPFPETATTHELITIIEAWNTESDIDAILIQVPLPSGIDQDAVTHSLSPAKDVDGFHPSNVNALMSGNMGIIPPVHEGILRLINESPLKLPGAQCVIIANSDIFAQPLTRLLTTAGASIACMKPDELDKDLLQEADLIITAVGRLNFINPTLTRTDAVIIDVGTNKTADGKTRGDVDAEAFKNTDVWLTPVPGGVGPMTIAQLLKNIVRLSTGPTRPA